MAQEANFCTFIGALLVSDFLWASDFHFSCILSTQFMPGSHHHGGGGHSSSSSHSSSYHSSSYGRNRGRGGGGGSTDLDSGVIIAALALGIFVVLPIVCLAYICTDLSWAYNFPTFVASNVKATTQESLVPGLENALTYDLNFYRVQIQDDSNASQPVYDYYGYQFGGLYRYTEVFYSSDGTSTYSMALTPWSDVCNTTLPETFASYPGFMDCERAATCNTAGKTTLGYGVIAAIANSVYFLVPVLLLSAAVVTKGAFQLDPKHGPLVFMTSSAVVLALGFALLYGIYFWDSFDPCTDGLATAVLDLNNTPGITADTDEDYDKMKGGIHATWIMLSITFSCSFVGYLFIACASFHAEDYRICTSCNRNQLSLAHEDDIKMENPVLNRNQLSLAHEDDMKMENPVPNDFHYRKDPNAEKGNLVHDTYSAPSYEHIDEHPVVSAPLTSVAEELE